MKMNWGAALFGIGILAIGVWWLVQPKTYQPGDANEDAIIDMRDVTKVERILLGMDAPTYGADANSDGVISVTDQTYIEQIVTGMVPVPPRRPIPPTMPVVQV